MIVSGIHRKIVCGDLAFIQQHGNCSGGKTVKHSDRPGIQSKFSDLSQRIPAERIVSDGGDQGRFRALFPQVGGKIQRSSAQIRNSADHIKQNFPE